MKKPTKTAEAKPAAGPRLLDARSQRDVFAQAVRAFNSGEFRKARELFEEVRGGADLAIAESAAMYAKACEQRLSRQHVEPRTPEEHYNFGISMLNQRRLDLAVEHLRAALNPDQGPPHVHYGLALALGLRGEAGPAQDQLRRAIRLDPQNRALARSDADFQPLLQDAGIREILFPERSGSA
jgi:tetratricopeptide (TPR) repeat protein